MPKQDGRKITRSQIVNWAAKMDDRSNSEVLNLTPDETGVVFEYLENADLYNSKALKNRKGVEDLACGIVNMRFSGINIVDVDLAPSGSTSSTTVIKRLEANFFDHLVTIFIPSGTQSIIGGTLQVKEQETNADYITLGSELSAPVNIQAWIHKLDQTPISGTVMSGTTAAPYNITHDIALSGNFNVPPFPQFLDTTTPQPFASQPEGIGEARITFSNFKQQSGGNWESNNGEFEEVEWKLGAPVSLNPQNAYVIKFVYSIPSSNSNRNILTKLVTNTGTDISPNSRVGETFYYIGAPASQTYAVRTSSVNGVVMTDKTWVEGKVTAYQSTQFLSPDLPAAHFTAVVPIQSGQFLITQAAAPLDFYGHRTTASIGQPLIVDSGVKTYYGAYGCFGLNGMNTALNNYTTYNADGTVMSGTKNVGISMKLWSVDNFSGAPSGNNFVVNSKTLLAQASGSVDLDADYQSNINYGLSYTPNPYSNYNQPNFRLTKKYLLFDTPVEISGNGSGLNHLLTFEFYDTTTGGPYQDYIRWSNPIQAIPEMSALVFGAKANWSWLDYSGCAMVDYSGDGVFRQFSDVYSAAFYTQCDQTYDITCGLLQVPSGNAIVGIYDYRIGDTRTSQIVYGQAGEIRYFDLDNPCKTNHTTLYSGISNNSDSLLSFATYDDILFIHDYSQVSGLCWDQVHSGTAIHGKRPEATVTPVSGVGGAFISGVTYSVLLASNYNSGGYRASNTSTVTFSGTFPTSGNFIELSGLANQFPIDFIEPNTYVFISEPSGSLFYMATIYSGATLASPILTQPVPSGVDVVYIQRPGNQATDSSIATVTNYDQDYYTSQVDTPKFKKMEVYYDYLCGIGDPNFPSRFWYSEQYAPQIWGESDTYGGFIDVDKDNNSVLTAIAKVREYLILFKENSCYRIEYLGDVTTPFSINPISSRIGSLGFFGTVTVGDYVYGLSQYGIFATNGATIKIISDAIDPFYRDIDHSDLQFAVAIHDQHEDKIMWSIGNNSSNPDRSYGITYNYKEDAWSVRRGGMWNAGGVAGDDDNFDVPLGGTLEGQIQKLEVDNLYQDEYFFDGMDSYDIRNTELVAETPWMNVGDSQLQKEFRYIDFNIERSTATLAIDVYFNENDTDKFYTRYIDLSKYSPDKRVFLGGKAKTIKFVFRNVGLADKVKIKNMNIYYSNLGIYDAL